MGEKLIIIGSGGHARSVIDSALDAGVFDIIGVISHSESSWDKYRGVPWIGNDEATQDILDNGCKLAALGIGFMGKDANVRKGICERYAHLGFEFPAIIDPSARVSKGSHIEAGAFIGKDAIVNANARVGYCSIVNSAAVIEHDCVVGSFSHIAVAAVLCGGVHVGNDVLVGANATVIQNIHVGDNAVIGAGATVLKDVGIDSRALGIFRGGD